MNQGLNYYLDIFIKITKRFYMKKIKNILNLIFSYNLYLDIKDKSSQMVIKWGFILKLIISSYKNCNVDSNLWIQDKCLANKNYKKLMNCKINIPLTNSNNKKRP